MTARPRGAALRTRREPGPFAARCLHAGARQGGLQGQFCVASGRDGGRRRPDPPRLHPPSSGNDSRPRAGVFRATAAGDAARLRRDPPQRHVLLRVAGRTGTFKTTSRANGASCTGASGREEFRAVLDGRGAARWPVRRRAARAVRLAQSAAAISPAAVAPEGSGDQTVCGLSASGASRRPRRQQAVASGAARPRLEDRLAQLGGGTPGNRGPLGVATGDFLLLKSAFGAQKFPAWITPSCDPMCWRFPPARAHRLRSLRQRPVRECLSSC